MTAADHRWGPAASALRAPEDRAIGRFRWASRSTILVGVRDTELGDRSRSAAERFALLDHAERIGGLGSWDWRPRTGELLWSDNLFRLFGLEPGSVAPSVELVTAYMHPADVERVEASVAQLATDGDMATFDYRIVRHDGVLRDLRAAVTVVEDEDGGTRVVGSVQDVTNERRLGRELAGRAAVSNALNDWKEFETGTRELLSGFATAMDLCFAVLWVPEHAVLTTKLIWHPQSAALTSLADATRGWCPGRTSAMLGAAWERREPASSNEPAAGATAERAAAMRNAGIQAALVIPAVAVDETLAVLEFLCLERIEPTDRLLRVLHGIGHEVGHFLAKRRGELCPAVLTPRELEVLQLAARALSAADIARQLQISRATVKRHFEDAYARLDVSDRTAAVAAAMRLGLIT
jgi:DNA-binding CsgD family transcriptional regulator